VKESVTAAKVTEIADAAHGECDEDVSGGSGANGSEDAEPGIRGFSYVLPYVLGAGDWVRILGARWTSGDQANTDHDEGDTGPALRANVLMQPKMESSCHDDVADGRSQA